MNPQSILKQMILLHSVGIYDHRSKVYVVFYNSLNYAYSCLLRRHKRQLHCRLLKVERITNIYSQLGICYTLPLKK